MARFCRAAVKFFQPPRPLPGLLGEVTLAEVAFCEDDGLFGALDRTLVSAHDTASLGWVVDQNWGAMRVAHAYRHRTSSPIPKGSALFGSTK